MRIVNITEGTTENMSIIRDISKLVLSNLPNKFEPNKTFTRNGYDFTANDVAPYTMDDLIKKYPSKENVLKHLAETTFDFIHYPENARIRTYGQYEYMDNTITINLAGIAKSTDTIDISTLLKDKNNTYGLIPVLFHEIRHAFQKKIIRSTSFIKAEQVSIQNVI